jgi:hypothetical protein
VDGRNRSPSIRQAPQIRGELGSGPGAEKMETAVVLEGRVEMHSRSVLLDNGFGK